MITFEPKNYVDKQKERFDTLFKHAPKSIAFKNDITYILKSTHHSISDDLNQIEEIEKQFTLNVNEQSKIYNQDYKQIKQELDNSIQMYASNLLQEKDNLKREEIKNNYDGPNQLFEINQIITEKTNNLFKVIEELTTEKVKKIKTIELKTEKHKEHYKKQITIIEDEKEKLLKERLIQYEKDLTINHKKNHERMLDLNIKQHEIETQIKLEQKSYDEDIISIKTAFNRVIIRINDNIKSVQKNFNKEIKSFEDTTIEETKKIEDLIQNLKKEQQDEIRQIIDQFGNELIYFDQKIDDLKNTSDKNSETITKNYTRDITINNQKLAFFKDEMMEKKQQLEKNAQYKRQLLDQTSQDYRINLAKINHDIKIERKKLDIQIEQKLKETKLLNIDRKKQFHKELLANEYYYITKLEFYRFKRTTKEMNKNNSIFLVNLKYEQKIKKLVNQRLRLEESLLIMNQILKEKQTNAIRPLDTQVSLARHIHDTEMNYRMSEHSLDKHQINYDKQKRELEDLILQEEILYERNLFTLNYQNDVKNIQIQKYLDIEYEKNKFNGDRQINELQKQLIELEFQKTEQSYRYHFSVEKERHINKQKEITFVQRNNAQLIELKEQKSILNHDTQIELEKLRFNYQLSIQKSKKIVAQALFEAQKQRKYLDLFYQLSSKIQSEQDQIYMLIKDLYRITDVETFNSSKDTLIEILEAQFEAKMQITSSLNSILTGFYQEKINELTAFKYMSLQKDIEDEYDQVHKQLLQEIKKLDDQIREFRKQSSDLYQEISFTENQIKDIEKTKELIRQQINALRESTDKQSRKTIKNLYLELQALNKDIIRHKNEISHLKLQISQINSRMKSAHKGYKPIQLLINKLKKNRLLREENLNKDQYKEGKIYYESIERVKDLELEFERFLQETTIDLKQAFNHFEQMRYSEWSSKSFIKTLSKSLINQKSYLNHMQHRLLKLIDHQYDHMKKDQDRITNELSIRFKKERLNQMYQFKEKSSKIDDKYNELTHYQRNYIKIQEKHLSNTLKMYKMHYVQKNNQLLLLIKQHDLQLLHAKEQKANLLKATEENSVHVIQINLAKLKQESKLLFQNFSAFKKEKTEMLNKLYDELLHQIRRYETQELHYSNHNKEFRKQLHIKQTDDYEAFLKTFDGLQKKYNRQIQYYVREENNYDKKIKFLIRKQSATLKYRTIKQKWIMSNQISKEKRNIKKQLNMKK